MSGECPQEGDRLSQAKLLDGIVRIYGTGENYPTLAAAIIKQRNIREAVAVARLDALVPVMPRPLPT